jgi:hypothetical protein
MPFVGAADKLFFGGGLIHRYHVSGDVYCDS